MGRYIDWSDVVNNYPSVARDRGSEQTSLGVVVDAAEGEVDARLAPRYTMPIVPGSSNAPQIVRTLAVDIVYYRLNRQQEWAKELREDIDNRFTALLDGKASLVTSAGIIQPVAAAGAWTSTPYRSSFGPDDATNYSVSQDWQDTAKDERDGD